MVNMYRVVSILLICFCLNATGQEFESFCAQYDVLSTIAGKGKIREKSKNGWESKFEGKEAIKAELSRPHFAMADRAGNIFIADKDANAIRKIDINGIITTVAGNGKLGFSGDGLATECRLSRPNGIWVQPNGTVFILDLGNDRIRKLDLKGQLITVFEDKKGISIGRGLYVNASEDSIFYCCNSEIRLWVKGKSPKTFSSSFSSLGNIVMNRTNELIATDRTKGSVYKIEMDGNKTLIAGKGTKHVVDGKNPLKEVRGVWPLEKGAYLLACHAGSKLWYLDSSGMLFEFLDGKDDHSHKGDGEHFQSKGNKVSEVRSVSIDHQGNIIICENDYGYIRKIRRK